MSVIYAIKGINAIHAFYGIIHNMPSVAYQTSIHVVLPRAAVQLLLDILREMAQGHAVTAMHAELTRQAQELGLGY
jgi:hypothetical protein